MDEIFAFIESLRNFNTKNIADYCLRCRELITNVEIHGAKKIIRNYGCSIQIDNIYIKTRTSRDINIEILINNKYMSFDDIAIKCLLINQQYGIAHYSYDFNGEYLYFTIDSCSDKVNGDINWLLDHKSTKSARK